MLLRSAQIASLPDGAVEQAILDAVLDEIGNRQGEALDIVSALPLGYRIVYPLTVLDAEVRNGGFLQYYFNSRAEFVPLAAEGLERLGADEHLAIFDEADERLASELDKLVPLWKQGLDGFFASYKVSTVPQVDERWFALPRLSEKLIAYIRQNPSDFDGATESAD
ncbi:MAG: DUF4375 domain-containing protein [Acidobacteriota bacterium]